MGIDSARFYDASEIAIIPMGYCYPGRRNGGDLPPRRECASFWLDHLLAKLPQIKMTLLVGLHAQRHFLRQRRKLSLTSCFLLTHFLLDRPTSYRAWHAWIESPMVSISAFIFCAALLAHMWVGLRDVILDYVKPVAVRLGALALLGLGLVGLGAWVIRSLYCMRFCLLDC